MDGQLAYSEVVMGRLEPDFMIWYGSPDDLEMLFVRPRNWGNPEVMHG